MCESVTEHLVVYFSAEDGTKLKHWPCCPVLCCYCCWYSLVAHLILPSCSHPLKWYPVCLLYLNATGRISSVKYNVLQTHLNIFLCSHFYMLARARLQPAEARWIIVSAFVLNSQLGTWSHSGWKWPWLQLMSWWRTCEWQHSLYSSSAAILMFSLNAANTQKTGLTWERAELNIWILLHQTGTEKWIQSELKSIRRTTKWI